MQSLRYALLLIGGFAIGWFGHDLTTEERTERAARRTETARRSTPRERPAIDEATALKNLPEHAHTGTGGAHHAAGTDESPPAAEGEAEGAAKAGKESDDIVEWVHEMGKQWSGWATMAAKQKLPALLEALGLDPATTKEIEAAILAEIERQVDRAMLMMAGEEEMNADAFAYFLGVPPDLSTELERKLATFLGDAEIAAVRTEVQKGYEKQLNDLADMEIGMMSIRDMTPDQDTRMREIFAGKNHLQEQFSQFAEAMRNRDALSKLMEDPKAFTAIMEENFAPTRKRVREILTPEQFQKYQAYEQGKIKQAEMGLRMMQGFMQQAKKNAEPPAQPAK